MTNIVSGRSAPGRWFEAQGTWGARVDRGARRGDLVTQRREEPKAGSQASFDRNEAEDARRPHPRTLALELEKKLAEALEQQTATS